jgi:hypothetical protein
MTQAPGGKFRPKKFTAMFGKEQSYVSKMSVSKMVFDQKEPKSAVIVWFFDSFQGKTF